MTTLADLRSVRLEKLNTLKKLEVDPYPAETFRTHLIQNVIDEFEKLNDREVTVTGRIASIREHGKLVFIDVKDASGKIQLYIKEVNIGNPDHKKSELGFSELNLLDVGDFIEAAGKVTKTQRGEISVEVSKIRLLSKSLRPLPDRWEGFSDIEERYRKRYIDFLLNEDAKKIIDARWKITKEVRKFLWGKGFEEVETPILQPLYGGTNAKPFTTHFNSLDADFYLRVAPELYLKRLIIGGYEKVFEIAKNFRNEGIDHSHFPEFTMLEWYEAYADYHKVMDLAEEMIGYLVQQLSGATTLKVGEHSVDVGPKWKRLTIDEVMQEYMGVTWEKISDKEAKELEKKYKVQVKGVWDKNKVLFSLFEHEVTPKLIEPTWVINYPSAVSPLARTHRSEPQRAERFEGYIGGVEIFDGWSEIISGIEQRARFENEQKNLKKGDVEAMPLDESFLEALEYGCPPLGGIGFGIDRLVMFLTNTWAIKDVVAFPTLKPRNNE